MPDLDKLLSAIDAAEEPLDFEASFPPTGEFLTFAPESTPIADLRAAIDVIRNGENSRPQVRLAWCRQCGGVGHVELHCRIRR